MSQSQASAPPLQFISGLSRQPSRSLAMQAHWRQRRKDKRSAASISRSDSALDRSGNAGSSNDQTTPDLPSQSQHEQDPTGPAGIPHQALSGMNKAISTGQLDPFDSFPVKLTSKHHKLLHHWLSTYATMVFTEDTLPSFNPMRDIWFPLDLSNAASFNGIMAMAAAHLSKMQGSKNSRDAIRFKNEAIHIITQWLSESHGAPSDYVIAGVVRLITFERLWGTEKEWGLHRTGLLNLTEVRGGIAGLNENWRLKLTVYFISTMAKPSWFDSSNVFIPGIFGTRGDSETWTAEELYRLRCLWLLSLVQDLRKFMVRFEESYNSAFAELVAVRNALKMLKANIASTQSTPDVSQAQQDVTDMEMERLECLFTICVLFQETTSPSSRVSEVSQARASTSHEVLGASLLNQLDNVLTENQDFWMTSIERLHITIREYLYMQEMSKEATYVRQMAEVLSFMSEEARYGVQSCLLHVLLPASSFEDDDTDDEEWTPDALLSSLRGS